jgi:flavin-dependent dehydrogenase
MKEYDIVIVGGSTTGSYFARQMSQAGHSVLVIDKLSESEIGSKYDIFHICESDIERFELPKPEEGDDFAFSFKGKREYSAFGRYPKQTEGVVVGMHMQRYTARMNRWAKESGAEYLYEAAFTELIYEDGSIVGINFERDGKTVSVRARLVADCSGIPSVVRRTLQDGYGVENFEITPLDMFYVVLRYVRYLNQEDYLTGCSRGWAFFKTWEAPEKDPTGAILGVGANLSFEYAEKMFALFSEAVELPQYELKYKEQGFTPYRRPPYSFVGDGFIAMGDAACLTRPYSGEGVASCMVQIDIAVEVVRSLLDQDAPMTRQSLWPINKRYYAGQGKVYAGILATLIGAVASSAKENDFFFKHDIIFSQKTFANMDTGIDITTGELILTGIKMIYGALTGKLKIATIHSLLHAMSNSNKVVKLYGDYPESPDGYDLWVERASSVWEKCGSMAKNLLAAENET